MTLGQVTRGLATRVDERITPPPDTAIRAMVQLGDLSGATTRIVHIYGPEIYGFLSTMLGNVEAAKDVYSRVSERFWRGLQLFRWDCSIRTWLYVIARNELARYREQTHRNAKRYVPLSQMPSVAAAERSHTQPFQRTTARDAIAALRAELAPEDRELLVLRLDRQMSWKDIALTFVGLPSTEYDLQRESTRLRQRFVSIKTRLAQAAVQYGLVPGG